MAENHAEAIRWFRFAAERGDHAAQLALAKHYAEGDGVSTNDVEAYAWYAVASLDNDKASVKGRDMLAHRLGRKLDAAKKHAAELLALVENHRKAAKAKA